MERKTLKFKPDSLDEVGTFTGMLSPYGRVDYQNDSILPGAYEKTIRDSGGKIPLLLGHDEKVLIGDLFLLDTPAGLRVKGVLDMELSAARDVHINLVKKRLRGMSIGYNAIRKFMENGVRKLAEIALREGSLTIWPAEPTALVDGVKSDDEAKKAEIIALLKGFSLFGEPRKTWRL
jgi:Escherichia/Staphylococcus phage prohead protease